MFMGEEVWEVIFTSGPRWFIFLRLCLFMVNHGCPDEKSTFAFVYRDCRVPEETANLSPFDLFLIEWRRWACPPVTLIRFLALLLLDVEEEDEDEAIVLLSSGPLWFMIVFRMFRTTVAETTRMPSSLNNQNTLAFDYMDLGNLDSSHRRGFYNRFCTSGIFMFNRYLYMHRSFLALIY